ncbi:MAG: asparaginase [Acidimicrobiales bacterium]
MTRHEPLVVEITRGHEIESRHLVDAVVVDHHGRLQESWGDPDRGVLPRSAIKPIQATALVSTGAADHFELGEVELALACASHSGEAPHVEAVRGWLTRVGLDEGALGCGTHPPLHGSTAAELARTGVDPGPLHNNCSGKHTAFLTVCAHLGLDPHGYIAPSHPIQHDHVTPAVEALCGVDLSDQNPAIDGCGIPVWSIPLTRIAAGWAALPTDPAGRRLLDAMTAQPFFVAGTGRSCTRLIEAAGRRAVVKTGAEGVYCATITGAGTGIALKVRDGARRASQATIAWLLDHLGVGLPERDSIITNHAGARVGHIRVGTRP